MARSIASALEGLARALVYALVFFLPLFFLPASLDPLELNKQTLLLSLTLCAFLAWIASMAARRRFAFRHGWLNAMPLLVLGATAASAFASSSPYLSWIGGSSQEYMSVLTAFALTLLFYVIVNLLPGEREHRVAHGLVIASAAVAGAVGAFSALRGDTLNTVGTLNALGVYLSAVTVFGCGAWAASRPDAMLLHGGWLGRAEQALVILLSLETVVVLLAANYAVLWRVLVIGLALLLGLCFVRARDLHDVRRFLLPLALVTIAVPLALGFPSPLRTGVPLEVTPSFSASADTARTVLDGEHGLLGSGPGTFAFDYALLRDQEVNGTSLWFERFDRAASFALTLASALGVIGLFAWGAFLLSVLLHGAARAVGAKAYRDAAGSLADLSGWSVLAAAAFLYPGNLTLVFLIFLFASLIASQTAGLSVEGTFERSPKVGYAFTAAVAFVSIGILTVLFVGVQRYRSEVAFARAVTLSSQGGAAEDVVAELDRAATLNRFSDAAYRQLALALVRRTDEEAALLADTATVSSEARAYVQALSAASVNAAVRATDLSPRNVLNWLARGATYRAFIPLVGNAGAFAVTAYERAIDQEPLNPANHVELGKTYLAIAESVRELTGSDDAAVAADAQAKLDAALASAEQAFLRAAALKADYAPAHYQLALTYERQGRLDDAVGKMESVAVYNPYDVGVAFQLGMLYMRRASDGDLARARAELERAVELAPTYANARWFLASVYEAEGNLAAAVEQIKAVLEYNPDNEVVRQRLERLRAGIATGVIPDAIE